MASTTAAKFLWKKNGPKPEANKKLDETSWLLGTTLNLAANNLDVTFKAGSRDYGLSASNADGKISELSLKKKYAKVVSLWEFIFGLNLRKFFVLSLPAARTQRKK